MEGARDAPVVTLGHSEFFWLWKRAAVDDGRAEGRGALNREGILSIVHLTRKYPQIKANCAFLAAFEDASIP
jgi:hypothetical protein